MVDFDRLGIQAPSTAQSRQSTEVTAKTEGKGLGHTFCLLSKSDAISAAIKTVGEVGGSVVARSVTALKDHIVKPVLESVVYAVSQEIGAVLSIVKETPTEKAAKADFLYDKAQKLEEKGKKEEARAAYAKAGSLLERASAAFEKEDSQTLKGIYKDRARLAYDKAGDTEARDRVNEMGESGLSVDDIRPKYTNFEALEREAEGLKNPEQKALKYREIGNGYKESNLENGNIKAGEAYSKGVAALEGFAEGRQLQKELKGLMLDVSPEDKTQMLKRHGDELMNELNKDHPNMDLLAQRQSRELAEFKLKNP